MKPLFAILGLLALVAALLLGARTWRSPAPGSPGVEAPGPGSASRVKGEAETRNPPIPVPGEPKDTGTAIDPVATSATGSPDHTPRAERQARSTRRMETIARRWLEGFSAESAMTEAQAGEIMDIVKGFITEYEALRWRRDVEEDVETTVERLYARTEASILARLGAGQKDAFRGLPRDWGFGKLDPGPLPEK